MQPSASSQYSIIQELRQVLKIAFPIVLAQVGMMTMGLVDTLVSGRIDTETLAGLGLASTFFGGTTMVFAGFLHALDAFFSQAMGAKNHRLVQEHLEQGLWTAAISSLASFIFLYLGSELYMNYAANARVAEIFKNYISICYWCIPAIFFFKVLERYWQSAQKVSAFAWIIIISNILNLFFDLALGLGWWGFPRWEAEGIAWSTVINRYWALLALLGFSLYQQGRIPIRLPRWNTERMRSFLRLGIPTGLQLFLEMGAFVSMSFVAGLVGAAELATHQIILNLASFSFMFALGFHTVGAVRVGRWTGAGFPARARLSGWLVIVINIVVMGSFSAVFILFPNQLLSLFTDSNEVILLGSQALLIVSIFQISDGIQTAATGSLRGLGNATASMRANFVGHYVLGIPLGVFLCFQFEWGILGLWTGAAIGLTAVAAILTWVWKVKTDH